MHNLDRTPRKVAAAPTAAASALGMVQAQLTAAFNSTAANGFSSTLAAVGGGAFVSVSLNLAATVRSLQQRRKRRSAACVKCSHGLDKKSRTDAIHNQVEI